MVQEAEEAEFKAVVKTALQVELTDQEEAEDMALQEQELQGVLVLTELSLLSFTLRRKNAKQ